MNEGDQNRFKTTLVGMAEVYGKVVTEELLRAYWATLQDITIDEFSDAVISHMRDTDCGQYFPKPADIIKKVKGTERDQFRAIVQDVNNTDRW